jgi:hypothetical protein
MIALFVLPKSEVPPELSRLLGRQIMVSFIVLTGALIAAMPRMERAALRDFYALRPSIRRSDVELQELERSVTHFSARGLWAAALLGQVLNLLVGASMSGFTRAPSITPMFVFPVTFWLVLAPATYVLLSQALLFRGLGSDLRDIVLFDLRPLKTFSRVGLRTALFYAAIFAIALVFHTDWGAETIWIPSYAAWMVLSLWMPIGLTLGVLPVWGAHRRLRAEKSAELDRISAAMAGAANPFEASSMAAHATNLKGIALLEYREKVEAVGEWPFDASGVRRLALYLLIPPLGWLGGALVERAIDRALQ